MSVMQTIHERIKWARQAQGFKTASEAARAFGWTVSTYLGYENGDREPGKEMLQNISKAFGVGLHFLIMGEGVVKSGTDLNTGLVVGEIGDRGEIIPRSLVPEGAYEAQSKLPFADDAIWLRVSTETLRPRYDHGDLIGCLRVGQAADDFSDGAEYALRLSTGQKLVRSVFRGRSRNSFVLISHNQPPILGANITWASEVVSVIRAANWTQQAHDPEEQARRRALMAQAAATGLFETAP
ncbi:helix-turn-helix transcriptional regulator [Lichenifustis flavocetrariae]|uniref:Helix-turn-helix domain-containing protein n=1 Tax=Lichenifustis flavocetrariae TaxID=2949735 RepID=A0AA42CMJ8_9HYPH|nr:helix-turn-helix transcriptional regulator [Lichenifustis flavocetrariae]MCW6512618.1 helix-turn-helix domain-containing protein [Lichenifustis flavocetrariae]